MSEEKIQIGDMVTLSWWLPELSPMGVVFEEAAPNHWESPLEIKVSVRWFKGLDRVNATTDVAIKYLKIVSRIA